VYFCVMKKIALLSILLVLLVGLDYASAQGCVTCTNVAAQLGQDSAIGLNKGIIYLAFMPLSITIGFSIYFYRRHQQEKNLIDPQDSL